MARVENPKDEEAALLAKVYQTATSGTLEPMPSPDGTTYFRVPGEIEGLIGTRWADDIAAAMTERTTAGAMIRAGYTQREVEDAIRRSSIVVD